MRLSVLLTLLLYGCALGNPYSSTYETVLLFYAYRIDIISNGGTATQIATTCAGSVKPLNTCTFDEFVKHIEQRTGHGQWTGATDIKDDLTPDVVHARQELEKSPAYSNFRDPHRLLPKKFPVAGAQSNFIDQFGFIVETVQKWRRELTPPDGGIADEIARYTQALELVHAGRECDQATYKITAWNRILAEKAPGLAIEPKTVNNPDIGTGSWQDVDENKTLRLVASKKVAALPSVIQAVKVLRTTEFAGPDGRFFKHARIVNACQDYLKRVKQGPACL